MTDNAAFKRIILFGDSNTFGYNPTDLLGGRYSEDIRWADIVKDRFKDRLEVIPRGMNGRTIPSHEYEIEALKRLISGYAPLDYFAIMLGTNDILLTDSPDWEKAAEDMNNLLKEIRGLGDFEILLFVPPILFPGSPVNSPFRKYEQQAINLADAYRRLGEKEGYTIIDAASWYVDLAYDGVHLSEKGSLEFADHLTEELNKIL